MKLETPRLILRSWRDADAPELFRYASHHAVGSAAGWPPHKDEANSLWCIRNILSGPYAFAICTKDDAPVGAIELKADKYPKGQCELGYWVGVPFWGQGLVPEAAVALLDWAFTKLQMEIVWCTRYDGNEKSHRVQQKLGFVPHHTDENVAVPLLGETHTSHISCLTRVQWLAARAGQGKKGGLV